jgi:hypothetical protein
VAKVQRLARLHAQAAKMDNADAVEQRLDRSRLPIDTPPEVSSTSAASSPRRMALPARRVVAGDAQIEHVAADGRDRRANVGRLLS